MCSNLFPVVISGVVADYIGCPIVVTVWAHTSEFSASQIPASRVCCDVEPRTTVAQLCDWVQKELRVESYHSPLTFHANDLLDRHRMLQDLQSIRDSIRQPARVDDRGYVVVRAPLDIFWTLSSEKPALSRSLLLRRTFQPCQQLLHVQMDDEADTAASFNLSLWNWSDAFRHMNVTLYYRDKVLVSDNDFARLPHLAVLSYTC